jgi:serine/threonine-protein kinase HipA
MIQLATVKIWNEIVGAVAWDEKNKLAIFEYDVKFKQLNWDIAPIKMPISAAQRIFSFPELRKNKNDTTDTFKGMPGLLADALPDTYGNQLINIWLAQQGRMQNSMTPVEMLCFIGNRSMGALEFEPATVAERKSTFSVEIDSMVNIAQKMLQKKAAFATNLKADEQHALLDILKIGTSAGGARPKAVIAYNQKTGEVRSGQTMAPKGFEHWLLKLDGVNNVQLGASKGYGRVEMAYYNMATACGINMMPCQLFEENGRAHFMTKRFDRTGGDTKHHIQSWCALQHFDFNMTHSYSYEQLFATMRQLKLSYADMEQMYRRMVFNVIARNCDDHTKNFSFMLKQNKAWALAPAYDICHAYRPGSEWVSEHNLSINVKRQKFTKADLLSIGHAIKSKKAEEIIEEINEVVGDWINFAKEVGVTAKLRNAINETLYYVRK